ncbi:50S ribosomal protein L24 [Candidatus Micrarchaeota archaeon]|nr:50S ribosomal protein L24 [Candidatus Micrarchaeota archaeon]
MKPDKERQKLYNSPVHARKNLLHVHLSEDLRKKTGKRAMLVKKGDKVKIMRGKDKGKEFKVAKVSYGKLAVYLEGLNRKNLRGKDVLIPFHPSNLMLTESSGSKKEAKKEEKKEIREAPVEEKKIVEEKTEKKKPEEKKEKEPEKEKSKKKAKKRSVKKR